MSVINSVRNLLDFCAPHCTAKICTNTNTYKYFDQKVIFYLCKGVFLSLLFLKQIRFGK